MNIKERFWSKTKVNEGHEWGGSKCIDWTAYRNEYGYGKFSVRNKDKGAHRVAFELTNGEIPDGLHVLHRCDRPCCVNPEHLFLGTPGDNAADRNKKGRTARTKGERNGKCKTTEDAVRLIKRFLERHPPRMGCRVGSMRFLSRWLGVSYGTIDNIRQGNSWRHVQ